MSDASDPTDPTGCQFTDNELYPNGGNTPVTEESFAGKDGSWTCLRGIVDDPSQSLHYLTPASYLDTTDPKNAKLKFSLMGQSKPLDKTPNPVNIPQPHYTAWLFKNQMFYPAVYDAKLPYAAIFPYINPTKTNPNVNPCGDTTFTPPSNTSLFTYYYGATVASSTYRDYLSLSVKPGVSTGTDCIAYKTPTCTSTPPSTIPNKINGSISTPNPYALDALTLFNDVQCFKGSCDEISLTGEQVVPTKYTSIPAQMRDGLLRLDPQPSFPIKGGPGGNKTLGPCAIDYPSCVQAAGMFSTGYDADLAVKTFAYSEEHETCNKSPFTDGTPSTLYLFDNDDQQRVRRMFAQIEIQNLPPDIHFAQTQDNYLVSFNIVQREPTCLSSDGNDPATNNITTAGWTPKGTNKTCDLPKNSSWGYNVQTGSLSNIDSWPNLTNSTQRTPNQPDIVVRIIFFNSALFDPTQGQYIGLTNQTITDLSDNLLVLMLQNTPNKPTNQTPCNTLMTTGFTRGAAVMEYISTIVYSLMYNFGVSLDAGQLDRATFFRIEDQILPQKGTYQMKDFIQHLWDLTGIYYNSGANTPVALGGDPTMSIQSEIDGYIKLLTETPEKYMKYPYCQLRPTNLSGTSSTPTKSIQINVPVHPMMHAYLTKAKDQTLNLGLYLNNFFQDKTTNNMSDGSDGQNIGDSESPGVLGAVSIQTGDNTYAGETGLPIQIEKAVYTNKRLDFTVGDNTYPVSYIWTADVTMLSGASFVWILQNLSNFGLTIQDLVAYTNPVLPTPIGLASTSTQSCLKTTDSITDDCAQTLCAGPGECLCDYSITLSGTQTNPTPELYFNNSNGPCACLASSSYPRSSQGSGRARNPVSECFAKTCVGVLQSKDVKTPGFCEDTGCSVFQQAIAMHHIPINKWYTLFPDNGSGIDIQKINQTCGTDIHKQDQDMETQFELNPFLLVGALCLGLGLPAGLVVDFFGLKNRRTLKQYVISICVAVAVFCLAGGLYYTLTGKYVCPSIELTNKDTAPCKDRLTGRITLTDDACDGHAPLFCQCNTSNKVCTGYSGSVIHPATCAESGVCAVCPNALSEVDIQSAMVDWDKLPTSWMFLAFGIAFFVSSILCVGLAKYFQRFDWPWMTRIGLLVGIGAVMATFGLVGVVAATNYTKRKIQSVNTNDQQKRAKCKDPCDASSC